MWRTTDADYGVTYSGCIADIDSTSTFSHADPSAGRYGASSDGNNNCSCSNTHSNRNNSSCGNQAGSHRDAGTSAY